VGRRPPPPAPPRKKTEILQNVGTAVLGDLHFEDNT